MRKSMISAPVFRGFRKVMPPMSRTEKEAIDAGTTGGRATCSGQAGLEKLHNYPQPRLTAEEQAFLDGPVEEACRMANDFRLLMSWRTCRRSCGRTLKSIVSSR